MRRVLVASALLACASIAAVSYQVMPGWGRRTGEGRPVPLVTADPTPYRVIPLSSQGVVPAPAKPVVAAAPPEPKAAAQPDVPATAQAKDESRPDVLASVSRTLEAMRAGGEAKPGDPGPGGASLGTAQVESLRQAAARRKVRPVTRMAFPLEPGSVVPAQVYLHPVPPDVAALSQGQLGFAVAGGRFVVVDAGTRKVVAVGGNAALATAEPAPRGEGREPKAETAGR
jgi:hypothetical protein